MKSFLGFLILLWSVGSFSVHAQENESPLEFIAKAIYEGKDEVRDGGSIGVWLQKKLTETGKVQIFSNLDAFHIDPNFDPDVIGAPIKPQTDAAVWTRLFFDEEVKNEITSRFSHQSTYYLPFDFTNDGLDDAVIWSIGGSMNCAHFLFLRALSTGGFETIDGPLARYNDENFLCSNYGNGGGAGLSPVKINGKNYFIEWNIFQQESSISLFDYDFNSALIPMGKILVVDKILPLNYEDSKCVTQACVFLQKKWPQIQLGLDLDWINLNPSIIAFKLETREQKDDQRMVRLRAFPMRVYRDRRHLVGHLSSGEQSFDIYDIDNDGDEEIIAFVSGKLPDEEGRGIRDKGRLVVFDAKGDAWREHPDEVLIRDVEVDYINSELFNEVVDPVTNYQQFSEIEKFLVPFIVDGQTYIAKFGKTEMGWRTNCCVVAIYKIEGGTVHKIESFGYGRKRQIKDVYISVQ